MKSKYGTLKIKPKQVKFGDIVATIKLTVDSNFDKAEKELKGFGNLTETEAKRLKRFQERYKSTAVDTFIQKQNRAAAAITATRGPVEALAVKHKGLQREIERLIRGGLNPQDAAVVKLRKEYTQTSRALEKNTQKSIRAAKRAKALKTAFLAVGAAAVAAGALFVKNAFAIAKAGDEYAKTGRIIGVTAEDLQELRFVAERSGVGPAKFTESMKKMNKAIGDTRVGSGALTTLLQNQNPELLKQIQNVKSNEEAFSLLNTAIADTENIQDKAALAQAAFGKTGQDMINIANLGAKEIAALREEARGYGLITNDAALQSEKLMDAQTNLKAALSGVRTEVATSMIPAFTKLSIFATKFTAFFGTEMEKIGFQVISFTNKMKVGWVVAVNSMKMAMLTFSGFVVENLVKGMQVFISAAERLPFVGEKFKGVNKALNDFRIGAALGGRSAIKASKEAVELAKERGRWIQQNAKDNIAAIEADQSARLAAIESRSKAGPGDTPEGGGGGRIGGGTTTEDPEDLKTRLAILNDIHKQAQVENVSSFNTFLKARMEQERITGEGRVEFLTQELSRIGELTTLSDEEKIAAKLAVNEQLSELRAAESDAEKKAAEEVTKIQLEQQKARFANAKSVVSGVGSIFSALDGIFSNSGKKSRALAILQKGVAVAQIGINTAMGVAQALGSAPPPLNFINAGLVTTAGVAAGVKAATTPIPTAETGGRFVVPDMGGAGVDRVGLNVGPGETIDVAARGEAPKNDISVIVKIDEQIIVDTVQRAFDGNELHVSTDNVKAA